MVGYNLYLISRERDECGLVIDEDEPYFLRLSYGSMREATAAKIVLETVYGKDSVYISTKCSEYSLVE